MISTSRKQIGNMDAKTKSITLQTVLLENQFVDRYLESERGGEGSRMSLHENTQVYLKGTK